jgi:zinc protease
MINKNKTIRWLGLLFSVLLLVLLVRPQAVAANAKHYTELSFPELSSIKLPKYERYELKNKMVVYLLEDHELPLVRGSAIIKTGGRLEPGDRLGLASITGTLVRSGGTQMHSAEEINQFLDNKAASIETGIDTTSGSANFDCLSSDLNTVFDLFGEILRYPVFDTDKIELAKNQAKGSISRRNDNPNDIASREFTKLIYGETSPYARTVEYKDIDRLSRQDLINFYQQYFRPDRIILGIVGDFDSAKMKSLIEKTFANWQTPSTPVLATTPGASQKYQTGVYFVDRRDLTQSSILLGHLGGQFDNPDYPAIDVMNEVLNGFGGRLFNEVRSRQGLAYSVYGVWSGRYDYPGLFIAGGQTRTNATVPFVKSVLAEIEKIRSSAISADELKAARSSILNSFVFNFEKPNQTLSRVMRYEYFGYPQDFIFQYQNKVKTTTIAAVQKVAQKYLDPKRIVTLIVGNSKEIQPPLSSLGKDVKSVDISIPDAPKS